jgi:hypothetical protein
MMIVPFKKIVATTLILLNLAVVAAPHIGHPEDWVNPGGASTLRSHDCGAHEIHKDIKDHADCLLCSRTTHFVGFVVYGQFPLDNKIELLNVPIHLTFFSLESTSPIFLRGPPAFLS